MTDSRTRLQRALVLAGAVLAMALAVAQVGEGPPGAAPAEPAPAAGAQPPADGIRELSSAEVDAELKTLDQVLSGRADPGEKAADKPLPADLGVPLPSDI